jgi:2-alkenal reductase
MRRWIGFLLLFAAFIVGAAAAGAVAGGLAAAWVIRTQPAALLPAPVTGSPEAATGTAERARAELLSRSDSEAAVLAAVRATRPAVVTVMNLQYVRENLFAPVQLRRAASGSGVIFDDRGYIATNAHVIENAAMIEVVFIDGRRAAAEVVQSEPAYDIAVLKLAPDTALPAVAPLADSNTLEPGMQVLAIGSPLGTDYQNTVTTGIIAGLSRRVKDMGFDPQTFQVREFDVVDVPLIQTDAAINTGNSGGPLINIHGEVVGLNTLIVRRDQAGRSLVEGLGFAVPSNVVRGLAAEWIDGIPRAHLGADLAPIDPMTAREKSLAHSTGAIVTAVGAGGPAQAAGLAVGDVIVAVDDTPLDLDRAFDDLLWHYRAGDRVRLTVDRYGKPVVLAVTFGQPPAGR